MGRKNKHKVEAEKDEVYCFYCEREFEDEKLLILHQKAKHFKCEVCNKKLLTVGGLVIHMQQVHKQKQEKVPAANTGRDRIEYEVYGMAGIPREFLTEKQKAKIAKRELEQQQQQQQYHMNYMGQPMGMMPGMPGMPGMTGMMMPPPGMPGMNTMGWGGGMPQPFMGAPFQQMMPPMIGQPPMYPGASAVLPVAVSSTELLAGDQNSSVNRGDTNEEAEKVQEAQEVQEISAEGTVVESTEEKVTVTETDRELANTVTASPTEKGEDASAAITAIQSSDVTERGVVEQATSEIEKSHPNGNGNDGEGQAVEKKVENADDAIKKTDKQVSDLVLIWADDDFSMEEKRAMRSQYAIVSVSKVSRFS